jgi:hypothetical protein
MRVPPILSKDSRQCQEPCKQRDNTRLRNKLLQMRAFDIFCLNCDTRTEANALSSRLRQCKGPRRLVAEASRSSGVPSSVDITMWGERDVQMLATCRKVMGTAVPRYTYLEFPQSSWEFPQRHKWECNSYTVIGTINAVLHIFTTIYVTLPLAGQGFAVRVFSGTQGLTHSHRLSIHISIKGSHLIRADLRRQGPCSQLRGSGMDRKPRRAAGAPGCRPGVAFFTGSDLVVNKVTMFGCVAGDTRKWRFRFVPWVWIF